MTFLQVNNPNDLQIINPKTQWIFINEELYTQREIEKMQLPETINFFNSKEAKQASIKTSELFTQVQVSKKQTKYFFGARFENKTENN